MTRMMAAAALVLAAGAGGALAQALPEGAYELDACSGNPYSDTRIEISGNRILFYESACTLTPAGPVPGFEGAYFYDGQCSGEGETWTERYMLMPSWDNGLVNVQPNWAGTYAYCGPATAPAPAPGGSK